MRISTRVPGRIKTTIRWCFAKIGVALAIASALAACMTADATVAFDDEHGLGGAGGSAPIPGPTTSGKGGGPPGGPGGGPGPMPGQGGAGATTASGVTATTSTGTAGGGGQSMCSTTLVLQSKTINSDYAIPLTNGKPLVIADVPVTLHVVQGTLYATRWDNGTSATITKTGASGPTLAGDGLELLAVWSNGGANGKSMMASKSNDGGKTWSTPETIGTTGNGPAVPSACVTLVNGKPRYAAVWSDMPDQSYGPLRSNVNLGSGWLKTAATYGNYSSGAALYCPAGGKREVVWRDDREKASSGTAVYLATVDDSATITGEKKIAQPAFDPSYCGSGSRRWLGFHTGKNDAHLAYSDDGWTKKTEIDADASAAGDQLDDTAKFVSVDCRNNAVIAAWGDWPSKMDASTHKNETRKLGLIASCDGGKTFQKLDPAPNEGSQGPAGVAVNSNGSKMGVAWKAPSQLRLAVSP
jgi:hypothetical protein